MVGTGNEVNLKVKHQDRRSRIVHINRVKPRCVRKDEITGNQDFQFPLGYSISESENVDSETIPMEITFVWSLAKNYERKGAKIFTPYEREKFYTFVLF
ncbi:hypothetical protein LOD99_8753 [Oopsacas minuta]|uniref:Uncharacterized protein n=1 Tax=Oopsacas minuta TaxID=111878 RepID=A0AAV7JGM7_9METZ|nr:hypothetical protein LOD99_8753 [Oopsacas minuta]